MGTRIFLGKPPASIEAWILAHYQPAGHPETRITFYDGSSDTFNWSGEINQQTMVDAGLCQYDEDEYTWIWPKEPVTVDIGNTVTGIGFCAFLECTSLASITIPDTVTSIGECALQSCTSLVAVDIPSRVVTIGNWAFAFSENITSLTIPSSVTSIGEGAFDFCYGLTSVTFLGKTMEQVQEMDDNYPWGIEDISIIHVA